MARVQNADQRIEADADAFLASPRGSNAREWIASFEAHFADRAPEAMNIIHERAMSLLRVGMRPEDVANTMKLPEDLLAMMMIADIELNHARSRRGTEDIARIIEHAQPPHAIFAQHEEGLREDVYAAFDIISGRAMIH